MAQEPEAADSARQEANWLVRVVSMWSLGLLITSVIGSVVVIVALLMINLLLPRPVLTRIAFSTPPFVLMLVWIFGTIKAYRKYQSKKVAGFIAIVGMFFFFLFPILMFLIVILIVGGWNVGK